MDWDTSCFLLVLLCVSEQDLPWSPHSNGMLLHAEDYDTLISRVDVVTCNDVHCPVPSCGGDIVPEIYYYMLSKRYMEESQV